MNIKLSADRLSPDLLLVFSLVLLSGPGFSQVKTWEGSITIPTYKWEVDVNPKFWAMEGGAKGAATVGMPLVYPYTMQDHLLRKLENVTYKAVYLENEYLRITCLPELGGRLHSVYDKTSGSEMFHKNSVIKPSMIAMRGAFISGGVEWNAGPQGHTVTVLSPVDVLSGKDEDGSGWIEISNLEKSLRTQWTVRVTLHPGKAFLEEDIRISNPAEAMNPYYFWNCTAFTQRPGTRFIYPMSLGTDHYGIRFFTWPVYEGKDLSWTKNYADASAIFAVDCAYDFFGAYDVDLDRGLIQVANHNEHSGKKAWTWGQGEYGRICQKNLTDSDGNYIEVQSGPMPTQSDYGNLAPKAQISWKEYWYPVHGLVDGFEFANKMVAFRTGRKNGMMEIKMIATEKLAGATLKIYTGDKEVMAKQVDLSPDKSTEVTLAEPAGNKVTIVLKSDNGTEVARYESPLPMPEVKEPEPPSYLNKADDQLTIGELYLKGQKYDRSLDRAKAREYYSKTLKIDPFHQAALRDLAVLDFEAALYDKAADLLTKALAQKPNDDGIAWYFLGLCRLKQNNPGEAVKCGFKASRCPGTESIGFDLAGRGYMLNGNITEALLAFKKATLASQYNSGSYYNFLIALYAGGQKDKSLELARTRINSFSTELTARALEAIITGDSTKFPADIRKFTGEKDFEILQTSLAFSGSGLIKEAIRILETCCIKGIDENKQDFIIQYHLAYLYSQLKDLKHSSYYLLKASKNYQDFILASNPETLEALEYAVSQNPGDALALYQMGNLYGNFGRMDEAADCWNKAVQLNPAMSIPWRNLGWYYWIIRKDYARSESCFQNAIKARSYDQTLYRDLAGVLIEDNKRPQAISMLEKMPYKDVRRSDIIIDLAQAYLEESRYDEAINILMSTPYFVNWEGSSITWNIFSQAHIRRGIEMFDQKKYKDALTHFEAALTFPENLGVGKSSRTEEAEAWFWKGKALVALGKPADALQAWQNGSISLSEPGSENVYKKMCRMLLK